MEKEKDLQRIFDLIELYDFTELPESERSFIRQHISEDEYISMRSTLKDTRELFREIEIPESLAHEKYNTFLRIARYPVELYKIVAIIVLLIGLGIILNKARTFEQQELLSMIDTVYIDRTDTVETIKETIIYKDLPVDHMLIPSANITLETAYKKNDCSSELCPDDMESFRRTKYSGNLSNDSVITGFIVTMQ
jgi:hypothetical protein